MDEFLALSSLLTGLPALRSINALSVEARMARDYLRLLKEQFGPGFDELLVVYRSALGAPDPLATLVQDSRFQGAVATAARQLATLWLLSQYSSDDRPPDQDGGFFEK